MVLFASCRRKGGTRMTALSLPALPSPLRAVLRAIVLALFAFAIFGPLLNLLLWAFAERWYFPNKLPLEFGLTFWYRVFQPRGNALASLGTSVWIAVLTVALSLAAPGLIASAIFVFLESLDEFTGTYFVGVPDVTTLPLLMFNASMGGNYQIASITALLLLIPSIGFMLVVERFLKADVLAGVWPWTACLVVASL